MPIDEARARRHEENANRDLLLDLRFERERVRVERLIGERRRDAEHALVAEPCTEPRREAAPRMREGSVSSAKSAISR